jgi:hypothetical protein
MENQIESGIRSKLGADGFLALFEDIRPELDDARFVRAMHIPKCGRK